MKKAYLVLFGLILLVVGIWFGQGVNKGPKQGAETVRVYDIPVPLPNFELDVHNGMVFNKWSLNRQWTFMFFGYIFCPDVCPTAMVDLNDVYKDLEEKGDLIEKEFKVGTQFVFVSVDPARDTIEELNDYVPHFNKAFVGLTGKPEVIDSIARPMGIAYTQVPGKDEDGDYYIDHSASFMLLDPLGRLRASFPPPHDPKRIVEEYRKIRAEFTEECCRTSISFTYINDDEDEEEEYEEEEGEEEEGAGR